MILLNKESFLFSRKIIFSRRSLIDIFPKTDMMKLF